MTRMAGATGLGSASPNVSPSKSAADMNLKIQEVIRALNTQWALGVKLPDPNDSPSKQAKSMEKTCVNNVKFLTYKSRIDAPFQQFQTEAEKLYSGWVNKPKAERGLLPEKTRHQFRPVSPQERNELLKLFINITSPIVQSIREQDIKARTPGKHSFTGMTTSTVPLNDRPLPLDFNKPQVSKPIVRSKRNSDELNNSSKPKRSKKSVEDMRDESNNPFIKPARPEPTRGPAEIFSRKPSESSIPPPLERGRQTSQGSRRRSANTSFASSHQSSIFDRSAELPATQETVPDFGISTEVPDVEPESQSSENFGSSFDPSMCEVLVELDNLVQEDIAQTNPDSFDDLKKENERLPGQEQLLRDRLVGVFPDNGEIPESFFRQPFHVQYEILRVFLATGVAISELKLPVRKQDWEDYDTLWNILRKLTVMEGKTFPEKSEKAAWAAANDDFLAGHLGVTMTGVLRYSDSEDGPLFNFRLNPLKLDKTHRLSRRFGCDRFMEIDIPKLNGRGIPKILQILGPRAKTIIIEWLGDVHLMISRMWVRFFAKSKERKPKKETKDKDGRQQPTPTFDSDPENRIFFFAIDGSGFLPRKGTPKAEENIKSGRTPFSVDQLLNWIRPSWENREQPTHKLNSRTGLALSRNIATVVLDRSQIRYDVPDIKNTKDATKDMTDGAGRMSQALAIQITQVLGLPHLPSGFQGRFGGAKGFWSVDPQDRSGTVWLEVVDSQRKWKREGLIDDIYFNDPAHRTFEVNKFTTKLKPAAMNQQLMPILLDRAIKPRQMEKTLKNLLDECLREEISKERIAMENPQAFLKWVRDSSNTISDRVQYNGVPYMGAIPVTLEEKMNMFLVAGFEPLKNEYLSTLARQAFEYKCDDLKEKMNVTIKKSTHALMVPDWTGELKEGEIYIHLPENFSEEELSLFSGLPLQNVDVLVARNPAHFASDIQRVRAVVAPSLFGLRDVIVFSTQGECLADKLSGGDYDGDIAWVCWEKDIVDNFKNAEVPKQPDLVKENYITKDAITYDELVKGKADETATFLNYSMEFSLEQKMVGMCTNYKEQWCYTYGNIRCSEAIYLSKLLSDLVDQAKSGYTFTEEQFTLFKAKAIRRTEVKPQLYKIENADLTKSKHIIDQLKQAAAITIENIKTEFARSLPAKIPFWDNDLVSLWRWADREGLEDPEWLRINKKLKDDVQTVKARWAERVAGRRSRLLDQDKPDFSATVADIYDQFQAILPDGAIMPENSKMPIGHTPLTRLLLRGACPELSTWSLLKASHLFSTYSINYVSILVWFIAGTQLCHLKSCALEGVPVAMIPQMYAMLKPDATFVKLRLSADKYQDELRLQGTRDDDDDDD